MLPARRPFRPVRLRPRRRHHARRRPPLRRLLRLLRRQPPTWPPTWPPGLRLVGGTRPARWRSTCRRLPVRTGLSALLGVAIVATSVGPASPAGARGSRPAQPAPTYAPPVSSPVVDPFRAPSGPYAAGNRGLEYDTRPGEPVRASADGTVVFAGPVAGTLHVTLRHADGVRTSYSFLTAVDVVLGQRVRGGDQLGRAGERLHFGARDGDAYFDPASLFAAGEVEVELLPFEIPPGSTPEAEARALAQLAFDGGGGLGLSDLVAVAGWLYDRGRTAVSYATQLNLPVRGLRVAVDLGRRLWFGGPCSEGPAPPAPVAGGDRVAITVAGLGSSSTTGSIDELRATDLGYDDDRVVRFSYAGGRVPGTGAAFAELPATDYESDDTQGDLRVTARRLADLVEDVAATDPDATIDLFAHSQGGIVARLALLELAARGVALDRLGLVTTLGTPHAGADLATAVTAANATLAGDLGLDAAEGLIGSGIDPDATSVAQLAEGSDVLRELADRGVPEGTELLSLAARTDLSVAASNTEVAGATNVTLPVSGWSAHSDLVGSDAATDEMARALAGQPPGCEGWRDVVADVAVGHGISFVEDQLGAAVLARLP